MAAVNTDFREDLGDRVSALVADDPAGYLPDVASGWRRIFGRLQVDERSWALLAYEPDVDNNTSTSTYGANSAWSAQMVEVLREHITKVLADDRGRQFHDDATELWKASLRGELEFRVAEPIRWDAMARSVWRSTDRDCSGTGPTSE